jgi:hypothetical protein
MSTQRVWLSGWEWECCGDPFEVGDSVTFMTDRTVDPWLADQLGPQLAEGVSAVEAHHEEVGSERVIGVVLAINGVALRYLERRIPRERLGRPQHDVPSRYQSSAGWVAMSGADPDSVISREPIPGSASLHPLPRVPWPPREMEQAHDMAESVPEFTGYLVDLGLRAAGP